jgi:hypothetical protein
VRTVNLWNVAGRIGAAQNKDRNTPQVFVGFDLLQQIMPVAASVAEAQQNSIRLSPAAVSRRFFAQCLHRLYSANGNCYVGDHVTVGEGVASQLGGCRVVLN